MSYPFKKLNNNLFHRIFFINVRPNLTEQINFQSRECIYIILPITLKRSERQINLSTFTILMTSVTFKHNIKLENTLIFKKNGICSV